MEDDTMGIIGSGCILLLVGLAFLIATFFHLPMTGEQRGYITAVDKGAWCTKVYIKTDLSSSQEDDYDISNSSPYVEQLKAARDHKTNVTLQYSKNSFGYCTFRIDGVK